MPAQSKSQQRFFGVVKAMQKGDIPKKGRAGKIAKSMSKDDVDDFASTKHKGKPEKVKREQRVRNLIKKMVREELNEKIGKGISFDNLKLGNTVKYSMGMDYKVIKLSSSKATLQLINTLKNVNKSMFAKKFDISKRDFDNAILDRQIRFITRGSAKVDEGTCGYGENGQVGEEPAGPHLIKKIKEGKDTIFDVAKKVMKDKQHQNYKSKKGMVKLDMQTANLLTQVFKKVNPKMKKILSDLGEKNPAQLVQTLQAVVK